MNFSWIQLRKRNQTFTSGNCPRISCTCQAADPHTLAFGLVGFFLTHSCKWYRHSSNRQASSATPQHQHHHRDLHFNHHHHLSLKLNTSRSLESRPSASTPLDLRQVNTMFGVSTSLGLLTQDRVACGPIIARNSTYTLWCHPDPKLSSQRLRFPTGSPPKRLHDRTRVHSVQ